MNEVRCQARVGARLAAQVAKRSDPARIARMVRLAHDDLARRHRAVARVEARFILASRRGATLGEVFAAGVEQYGAEGFADEWELHHQGGLTGYSGREIFATPGAAHRLESGQALAWNPSIRRVKSEDTILVTADRPELLTFTNRWPTEAAGEINRPALLIR